MDLKAFHFILLASLFAFSCGQTIKCNISEHISAVQEYDQCIKSELLALGCLKFATFSNSELSNCFWCYDKYECFQIGGPFISLQHPISRPPQHPDIINVKMQLYTWKNPVIPETFASDNIEQIHNSNFDSTSNTIFLIGGYRSGDNPVFRQPLTKALLEYDNYNVFFVNWKTGSQTIYSQATANARLVGRQLAYFIQLLNKSIGYSYSKSYLIGHSLGSHICGYAGEMLPGLGRITGLDPAGPYFLNTHPRVRLDPTDADFVDVIHTDRGVLGINQQIGHIDFYPNSGRSVQPGCEAENKTQNLFDLGQLVKSFSCSHGIAYKFFIQSIPTTSDCTFTSYACNSFLHFILGTCAKCNGQSNSPNCARMGLNAHHYKLSGHPIPAQNKFFLRTNPNPPYCQN